MTNVRDFWQPGDGEDWWPAFTRAHSSFGAGSKGGKLRVPAGVYSLSDTFVITKCLNIEGDNSSQWVDETATQLIFPADTTGVRIHSLMESPDGGSGSRTRIADLSIRCSDRQSTGHGIWASAPPIIERVNVQWFAEDGILIKANAALGTGNANGWSVRDTISKNNGKNGLHVSDADANAGNAYCVDCGSNGEWDFLDDAKLNNGYIGCRSDGQGIGSFKTTSQSGSHVFFFCYTESKPTEILPPSMPIGGNLGGGDNLPRLTITGDGSGAKALVNGCATGGVVNSVLMLNSGSGYTTASVSILHGSGSGLVLTPVIVGGKITALTITNGGSGYIGDLRVAEITADGTPGGFRTPRIRIQNRMKGTERAIDLILGDGPNQLLTALAFSSGGSPGMLNLLAWNEAAKSFETQYNNSPTRSGVRFVGDESTTETGGRSVKLQDGSVEFPQGHWNGGGSSARYRGIGTAAPTSGEYARGDIIENRDPAAGGSVGWICTTGGTPGTWKTFGAIST